MGKYHAWKTLCQVNHPSAFFRFFGSGDGGDGDNSDSGGGGGGGGSDSGDGDGEEAVEVYMHT